MGLTHHEHGVHNVQAVANLALLRGMVGGRGRGLLPLRGHSNVQGIGSMGVTPKLRDSVFQKLQSEFKIKLPDWPGMDTLACMHAAHDGSVRFATCLGGNLFGSNPDAKFAAEAMSRIDQVVYLSTTLNTGHAWGRGRETIILPVKPRDEESQSTTQESMFNFVRLSDGGPARHEGPRSEVEVVAAIGGAVLGDRADLPMKWNDLTNHEHIRQLIARIIPGYEKLGDIGSTKKEFTIDGRVLHEARFATDTGRAKLHVITLPELLGEGKVSGVSGQVSDEPSQHSALSTQHSFLRLMTLRSEGQFNTVVYEDQDIYRGQERRDVILMNVDDIRRLRLREDTVRNSVGAMPNILVREFDLPPGNAAMYYPEANVLIPREADPLSKTPRFKSVLVEIER
jgi:anaerobic selenocysteine-containing dehydrogenase